MGMFLGARVAAPRVASGWGALYMCGAAFLALPLAGILIYELGVTYFQLALFFFLNLEYAAESWQSSSNPFS